jgi:hypothetical protein
MVTADALAGNCKFRIQKEILRFTGCKLLAAGEAQQSVQQEETEKKERAFFSPFSLFLLLD